MKHAFVIPAYRESPYLAQCVASLLAQTSGSELLITTSTPNEHIDSIARSHGVPVMIGRHRPGIAADWNFALTASPARLVTVAHQDDVYAPAFADRTRQAFARHPDADLVFTAFSEHSSTGPRPINRNLLIKRLLTRWGFGASGVIHQARSKRRLLAWGNPICCPSVTVHRGRNPDFRFSTAYRSNLDWDAWARLAAGDGCFVYLREVLIAHRVHPETETTAAIVGGIRDREDLDMLMRFWPDPTARLLARFYRHAYGANQD